MKIRFVVGMYPHTGLSGLYRRDPFSHQALLQILICTLVLYSGKILFHMSHIMTSVEHTIKINLNTYFCLNDYTRQKGKSEDLGIHNSHNFYDSKHYLIQA